MSNEFSKTLSDRNTNEQTRNDGNKTKKCVTRNIEMWHRVEVEPGWTLEQFCRKKIVEPIGHEGVHKARSRISWRDKERQKEKFSDRSRAAVVETNAKASSLIMFSSSSGPFNTRD